MVYNSVVAVTDEKMYTTGEVAEKLRVTRRTVYNWLSTGRLKAVKAGPKIWLVSDTNLRSFVSTPGAGEEGSPVAEIQHQPVSSQGSLLIGDGALTHVSEGWKYWAEQTGGVPIIGDDPVYVSRGSNFTPKSSKKRRRR